MKKVLFASTALVAGAFVAPQIASAQGVTTGNSNAEVSLDGYARWGVGYNEDRDEESILISRFRLNINAILETDSGLRFAATVRGQSDENADGTAGSLTFGGARYQISTGGLRVRFGNISGVFDDSGTIRPYSDVGLEGTIGIVSSFGFPGPAFGNGSKNNGILVNYNTGDWKFAASYVDESQNTGGLEDWQVGVGYTYNGWNFGAVYGNQEGNYADDAATGFDDDYWLISVDGSFGAVGFHAVVGENENNDFTIVEDDVAMTKTLVENGGGDTAYGFSLDYDVSAATNIKFVYSGGGVSDATGGDDQYAIGFLHDLGSGASLRGFVGQNAKGSTVADLGVRFNF